MIKIILILIRCSILWLGSNVIFYSLIRNVEKVTILTLLSYLALGCVYGLFYCFIKFGLSFFMKKYDPTFLSGFSAGFVIGFIAIENLLAHTIFSDISLTSALKSDVISLSIKATLGYAFLGTAIAYLEKEFSPKKTE